MYALWQEIFCIWITRSAQKPNQFLRMRCATYTSLYTMCVSLVWQLSQGNNSVETDGRTEPKHVRPETEGKAKHASLPRLQNLPTTVRPSVRPLRSNATFNLVTVEHISKSPFCFTLQVREVGVNWVLPAGRFEP
jgi:hypothetical protein